MNNRNSNSLLQPGRILPLVVLILLVALSACGGLPGAMADPSLEAATAPATDAPGGAATQPERGQAQVDAIEILILESFPVQVNAIATGNLADGCTQIDEVISQRDEDGYRVVITTIRQPDAICTQALVPFEESVSLDVAGAAAGTYSVDVNGVADTFTLDIDNTLPEPAEPTAEPTATGAEATGSGDQGRVNGMVWHDLCTITGTSPVEDESPPDGCVLDAESETIRADGILADEEPGIADVVVRLFPADCTAAAPGEETIVSTDPDGRFSFDELTPDIYCVFFDTDEEINAEVLETGFLTHPTSNGVVTNSVTVEVAAGDATEDVNFGYDFEFLPLPDVAAADCINSFRFVQDLTVPDDTVFAPGSAFSAAWRLENNGTCPWTEDYAVAFAGGDQMEAAEATPLTSAVAPGQTADVAVDMIAPGAPGTYRGNWQLSDANGTLFGVDGAIEDAFWVQIVVEEGAEGLPTPSANSAVIGGVVWEDICFLTADGSPSSGCVEADESPGLFRGDGSYGAGELILPEITVTLGVGACPADGVITPANRLDTTLTDAEGLYRFTGLEAAIYCVAIDALSAENINLLIPGNWTWPAQGIGRQTVRLSAGQEALETDFGWDYQE